VAAGDSLHQWDSAGAAAAGLSGDRARLSPQVRDSGGRQMLPFRGTLIDQQGLKTAISEQINLIHLLSKKCPKNRILSIALKQILYLKISSAEQRFSARAFPYGLYLVQSITKGK